MKTANQPLPAFDFGVVSISREHAMLMTICLIVLALRMMLINLNQAEYTDGILQLIYFQEKITLWPPIYPLLCKTFTFGVLDIEFSAKMISIIASVGTFIPLYFIARALCGRHAAIFAVLIFACQPIAWRWSIRVMTDSLFTFLFIFSLALLVAALRDIEQQTLFKLRAFSDRRKLDPYMLLTISILLGVVAGLTRFTGGILIPLQFYALWKLAARPGQNKFQALFLPLICMGAWLFVLKMFLVSEHGAQISERASGLMLISYLNVGESFLYFFPYFVTLPVFFFMVWGWVRLVNGGTLQKQFFWIALYLFGGLIATQTIFQSFQSRYLLPLIPLVAVLAAAAFDDWRERSGSERNLFGLRTVLAFCLIYSLAWSGACLVLQKGMWGDLRQAAEYVKKELAIPRNKQVFSNEVYNPWMQLYAVKDGYWTGLDDQVQPIPPDFRYPEDCYLILHSSYGGEANYNRYKNLLYREYHLMQIMEFDDWLVPLYPDIMAEVGTHQNPSAWFHRYFVQNFRTSIFHIERPREQPDGEAPR